MKTWTNAELVELSITATAEGGRNLDCIDNIYTDKITRDAYASFASGGNAGGEEITVIR